MAMLLLSRLLSTVVLALATSATSVTNIVPPASKGVWNDPSNALILDGTLTDTQTIANTAVIVDQKAGPSGEPNQPVQATVVTAIDGQLTEAGSVGTSNSTQTRRSSFSKRSVNDYELVFEGTGVSAQARDAYIQGTAYLTYKRVSNSTYNVADCLAFCDSVEECVFANLYYEFNDASDQGEKSNLKCAIFADTHSSSEKTNWGGDQLEAPPAGQTYIQQSSGWAAKTLVDPEVPEGYQLVFGPSGGANVAPGYMGFVFLDRYDVDACASECNARGADGNGGVCQYFNIWRAVVDGNPATYSCSLYYFPSDASTATNTGQGALVVTLSRGYSRKNYVVDGGFEAYAGCADFCYKDSYSNWVGTSPAGGVLDASIFFYQPYAHFGNTVALLGSATAVDALAGILTPAKALQTVAGKSYIINFFHASAFAGPSLESSAFVDVLWNGKVVSTIKPGFSNWQYYSFTVTGAGNDVLAFHGGKAPAWSFIDDVSVFEI